MGDLEPFGKGKCATGLPAYNGRIAGTGTGSGIDGGPGNVIGGKTIDDGDDSRMIRSCAAVLGDNEPGLWKTKGNLRLSSEAAVVSTECSLLAGDGLSLAGNGPTDKDDNKLACLQ